MTTDQLIYLDHRLASSSDPKRSELITFLDSELRKDQSFSVDVEYPSLFGTCPGGTSIYTKRNGQIISHVGFVIREYRHSLFNLKIGLIGSVTTHSQFRNEGLAKNLLNQAIQILKEKNCVLAILWSDQPDFYSPLGFFRAGQEKDFRFVDYLPSHPNDSTCRRLNNETDLEQVWQLYLNKNANLDRSLEEMRALVSIPKVEVYVTEKNKKVVSYLALHKGADFKNYIHEWGGELRAVRENLISCKNQFYQDAPLTLIAPFETEEMPLKEIAQQTWVGSLGLVKVLDRKKLIDAYLVFLKSHSQTEEGLPLESLEDEELILWILGKDGVGKNLRLPFFLWGFDSI